MVRVINAVPPEIVPDSDALMLRQDQPHGLELLLAQRRIFKSVKWIRRVRIGGALIIALAGPFLTTFHLASDNLVGSLAGIWVVLSLVLWPWESSLTVRAAKLLEEFDCFVFGLPWNPALGPKVEPEYVADRIRGFDRAVRQQRLPRWYDVGPGLPGPLAVLLAQRIACVYSQRIHRAYCVFAGVAGIVAAAAVLLVSVMQNLSLGDFLAGVALPILPGIVALNEIIQGNLEAARQRRTLGETLYEQAQAQRVTDAQLRANQDAQYRIRSTTPPLPDLIYKIAYSWNERAMAYSSAKFVQLLTTERP